MLRVLLLGLFLPCVAVAQELPQPLTDTVSDFAGILTPAAEADIAGLIERTRDETGVHVAVATMERIADYGGGGGTITSYARALFNAWGIGAAGRNDGILILVAVEDREARIALGSAYDAVYDGRAQRVIDTAMLPEFREDRFAKGILDGVQATRERLVEPFIAGNPVTVDDGFAQDDTWTFLGLGAVAAAAAGLFGLRSYRNGRRRCPKCRNLTLKRVRDIAKEATATSEGTGIEHLTCTSCGHTERHPFIIPVRRESSRFSGRGPGGSSGGGAGGSSGGFGGGRSSGGGATGKW
ncbi:MAG: TPM domain-containing protein [Tabrizicola sp.]|uniref:TPM domain-containing protein n=1 Tax=Tabrizicola sp. TaxID=2005166 RepID=UPI002736054E|nr:TPM domain-containing protein [Tabrizicola sp.]MDP3263279.1 TPM domain-containing protein [Tabrizicola sp.]MDP3646636.1 TPM domain-containing protein [Paracoccaceae bacterium]MDZ4065764.1 TPM domain-containing protein [Tabrizicola sp.]